LQFAAARRLRTIPIGDWKRRRLLRRVWRHAAVSGVGRRGFTLVELLVVIALIAILAAIAIPQFSTFRQRSLDASAVMDLRNAANAEEQMFATTHAYVSCRNANCQTRLTGFHRTPNVTIRMRAGRASFTGTATHSSGSGKVWVYDSAAGGLR